MNFKIATASLLITGVMLMGDATLNGTTPPESYPLTEADPVPNPVDPALNAWWQQHVDKPSPLEMDVAAFKEFVKRQDPLTGAFLVLMKANRQGTSEERKTAAKAMLAQIGAGESSQIKNQLGHPLLPAAYFELLQTNELAVSDYNKVRLGLDAVGSGSCAKKQAVFEGITPARLQTASTDELLETLAAIDGFRSSSFKRNALRRFLYALPEDRVKLVKGRVLGMVQPYQGLIANFAWLKKEAVKGQSITLVEPLKSFEEARAASRQKLCSQAKDLMLKGLSLAKATDSLHDALLSAKAIGGCYRTRSSELRRDFWHKIQAPVEQAYGFKGWAEVRLRLGYLYWSVNDFENSKKTFNDVIVNAAKKQDLEIEGKAVFAMARIAENQSDYARAMQYYHSYVERFADQENYEEALMAIVLLHADKREWQEAIVPLKTLIDTQTDLPGDDRSVSALSFAFFWAGRIYLEQDLRDEATEMWRRGASEFYSTYYGAMSHYMLEKLTGRTLVLEPSRTPSFRMDALREAFAPDDKKRVVRIETFMRLGLRSDAVCELEEIDLADGKPEKVLVKAMVMHATGEWLAAIKAYDSLPRAFRHTLPVGFERLLFPRRYVDLIQAHAAKAEVDPDLVMAIIRQESVFNPMARSPAGAMGLMQLMPHTAKVESKRLAENYLPAEERRLMRQRAENPQNLLVPETNLALGIHHVKTLLSKYPGPVYVLSAYNASPSAAKRWMTSIPTDDVLSFIEKIPYRETRAYVKLVLRNYFYYKRWYDSPGKKLKHIDAVTSPLVAMAETTKIKEEKPTPRH